MAVKHHRLLEFLIPTFNRFDGAIEAAISVASQIKSNSLEEIVSIRIVDDASCGFSEHKMANALSEWIRYISIVVNPLNKGMSLNIYDMVATSNSHFCTVLTDDDWLFPGSLPEIISYLELLVERPDVGGLFTPRYSYLEDGSLNCVVCNPFAYNKLLLPGPINSLKYSRNGFVLTGFIFRPALMAKAEWTENIQNGYFPVINFWGILTSYSLLYINRNWFYHTVLNHCHWEAWGDGENAQKRRLNSDYLDAIAFMGHRSSSIASSISTLLWVFVLETNEYLRRLLNSHNPAYHLQYTSNKVKRRLAFWAAISLSPFVFCFLRLRSFLVRPLKPLLKFMGFSYSSIRS